MKKERNLVSANTPAHHTRPQSYASPLQQQSNSLALYQPAIPAPPMTSSPLPPQRSSIGDGKQQQQNGSGRLLEHSYEKSVGN